MGFTLNPFTVMTMSQNENGSNFIYEIYFIQQAELKIEIKHFCLEYD
jgi:hypothetical protein